MNVASLDLCKELYELSGKTWHEEIIYSWHKDYGEYVIEDFWTGSICPAYDLGYLLRKLPDYAKLFRNNQGKWFAAAVTGGFRHPDNQLGQPDTAHEWYIADTPEDAAASLAIKLFQEGILK